MNTHLAKKWTPSGKCFRWYVLALSVRKRIFLKTKKADPKHCENWRRESGSEFHKTSPMCEQGEWQKQLRDFITQSLKQTPLSSSTVWRLFGPNGIENLMLYSCMQWRKQLLRIIGPELIWIDWLIKTARSAVFQNCAERGFCFCGISREILKTWH